MTKFKSPRRAEEKYEASVGEMNNSSYADSLASADGLRGYNMHKVLVHEARLDDTEPRSNNTKSVGSARKLYSLAATKSRRNAPPPDNIGDTISDGGSEGLMRNFPDVDVSEAGKFV
mmetsp:Transcript_12176/g.16038  ORF Transcript_12176/g.16038 Transcript_12176/m.16038 type:complete len:117 (+) Transcript_12176:179-529(+)